MRRLLRDFDESTDIKTNSVDHTEELQRDLDIANEENRILREQIEMMHLQLRFNNLRT